MPQTAKQIKKAIKAIGNIKKTTKTMQLISSSKMQKNLRIWVRSKKYLEQLAHITKELGKTQKDTVDTEIVGKTLLISFASDRGLCGSFNTKIIVRSRGLLKSGTADQVIAIGKRAGAIKNTAGDNFLALYPSGHNNLNTDVVRPVSEQVAALISSGAISKVEVVYTRYESAFVQAVTQETVYPFAQNITEETQSDTEYLLEPDASTIQTYLMPIYLEGILFRCWIESAVSEHTARMQAMKNATDAAKDIITSLTLELNKTRQAAITQEIAQIMGARKSMQPN